MVTVTLGLCGQAPSVGSTSPAVQVSRSARIFSPLLLDATSCSRATPEAASRPCSVTLVGVVVLVCWLVRASRSPLARAAGGVRSSRTVQLTGWLSLSARSRLAALKVIGPSGSCCGLTVKVLAVPGSQGVAIGPGGVQVSASRVSTTVPCRSTAVSRL
jgi:hypothetical protein